MKISLIRIGNSQGIRIPASIIKQCGFEQDLELNVKNKTMIVSAAEVARKDWQKAAEKENKQLPLVEKGEWVW